mgnify:CR=1 FL=1
MDVYSITSVFVCGHPSYNLPMRHALPIIALFSLAGCGSDPDPVTVAPTTASAVMIDDDPQHNARRFSRPVTDVDIDDFRIWHGHDLMDPKGMPTTDGLAADLGGPSDVLEVPRGEWDKAVIYTGFGNQGAGNRFVAARTLQLIRDLEDEDEAIAFHRRIALEAADRFGDEAFAPSPADGSLSLWRIDDPDIDWGWPRSEARIHRDGMRVVANYQLFLQDRAIPVRRVGRMRPLGSSGGPGK